MDKSAASVSNWKSPIPEKRWKGFRRLHRGIEAFQSLETFEKAQLSELEESLEEHERKTLGRLLARGKKIEIEVFIRSHGANPIFHPQEEIDVNVGVAKADVVSLTEAIDPATHQAILNGDVVHALFQAGEATRFGQGPFYLMNPLAACDYLSDVVDLSPYLTRIEKFGAGLHPEVRQFLVEGPLGPKQPVMIRAALRRVVQSEINAGRLSLAQASQKYAEALAKQKLLFFVTAKNDLSRTHFEMLKNKFHFFGFDPNNIVTVDQQQVRGITADEYGALSLVPAPEATDSVGHLYALLQAVRPEDFTTYSESGRPLKSADVDALSYLAGRGGKILNVIRINDMDRHTTEIINPKALNYALKMFANGFVNVIESVANQTGQKGGTGTTFNNPDIHVLTETHENSFPSLSRAFEKALQEYLTVNKGSHPAYNAMRQWADLAATRQALREFGGRIVFVPRQKESGGKTISYLGVDMPMGDLSLLHDRYKSRMFQFVGPNNKELHIHDMKTTDSVPIALRTIERQLQDPHIIAAAEEVLLKKTVPFQKSFTDTALYGAPAPEFERTRFTDQ